MTGELAAGSSQCARGEIERAFARAVMISPFLRLGGDEGSAIADPVRPTEPPGDIPPADHVIHARFPTAFREALHLQLEAWDDGSYRLSHLATEGPAHTTTAEFVARKLADRFETLMRYAAASGRPPAVPDLGGHGRPPA